jgi:hypothetical protein
MTLSEAIAHQAKFAPKVEPSKASGEALESDLHEKIFAECRHRGWIAFHGAMSNRTHRTLGEPDFVILADAGRVFLVECKAAKGKLSKDQQSMNFHARVLGHEIHCVRSIEQFLAIVRRET